MATRSVVTKTRIADRSESKEFTFTREMMPALKSPDLFSTSQLEYWNRAWNAYESLPIPTTSDEAWRRTDLRGLRFGDFKLAGETIVKTEELPTVPDELLRPLVSDQYGGQILIDRNQIRGELTDSLSKQGVIFTDIATARIKYPDLVARVMGKIVRPEEGKFAALAGAFANTGIFVYIPRGVSVVDPLHSILWGPGRDMAYLSHILVLVDHDASVTYIHEAASPTEMNGQTLHAGLVELMVEDGANLRFVELQSWGEHVWNFSHERARVGRNGSLDWVFGAVGSHLTKNFSDLDLAGEGAVGKMSGFYFTENDQHLDHDTQQNHLAPHTTSDLLFKGALKGRSRSVWQGMIYVAPGAQKTDGYQANRNLVLSGQARADSIPGLEILADDVRCTHGATVGKIDATQVFYLRSRGIPYSEAERLIVEGFFDPIMQRIPYEGVRSRFQTAITEKMS